VRQVRQSATQGFSAGQTLGHYEILSILGKAAMGEVYLAAIRASAQRSAEVRTRPIHEGPGTAERFEQEARAASALNHPNIITIYEIGAATAQIHGDRVRRWRDAEEPMTAGPLEITRL
jgi:serine/threonine protein kinase